jgi:hypothetical protein
VEVYNPSPDAVDLTGWRFQGEGSTAYAFPQGSLLPGREYLVLSRDTLRFRALRPNVRHLLGNLGFGLSSSGETLLLMDAGENTVDSVTFAVDGGWPSAPNGTGSTLSLVNPQKANALAENWRSSLNHGTPGTLNDVYARVGDETALVPYQDFLLPNYPNPFNPTTKIPFGVSPQGGGWVRLAVFDMLGREVAVLVNERKAPGNYEVGFDAAGHPSGVYIYRLATGSFVRSRRMLLIR